MQSGRRFFITGWRRSADALTAFEARLARAANGTLEPVVTAGGKRWLFVPQDDGDVLLARGLCAEYGVALCLRVSADFWGKGGGVGAAGVSAEDAAPCLIVDPVNLHALQRCGEGAQAVWRAQAGCTLASLSEAGLTQFSGLSPHMTLAQWASASHEEVPTGQTARTGVVGADVLFSDGTVETLGGFGAADTRALKSPRVQAIVPALFELARSEAGRVLRDQPYWSGTIRLDALLPAGATHVQDVNIARVFLGSQGRYGWVLQWLLRLPEEPERALPAGPQCTLADDIGHPIAGLAPLVLQLDHAVGQVLDPENRYGGATTVA